MMPRIFSVAMFLTAVFLVMTSDSLADSSSEPCCLPAQFTCLEQSRVSKHWYKVYTDFTNNRKLAKVVGSNDFLYLDLASGITYQHFGDFCTTYPTPKYITALQCAPENTTLDVKAGFVEGEIVGVYAWKVASELTSGEVTLTQDKCYPVTSSLTDVATGKSLYMTYSNVEEGVDLSVFENLELSNCSPSL